VDPETVNHREQVPHPVHPPGEFRGRYLLPAIDGIPPPLSGGAEVIGRYSCHCKGSSFPVKTEQSSVRPDVSTFIRRVQRKIPNDADPMILCKFMESVPLREREKLDKLLFFKRSAELPALFLYGSRFPVPEWIRPV